MRKYHLIIVLVIVSVVVFTVASLIIRYSERDDGTNEPKQHIEPSTIYIDRAWGYVNSTDNGSITDLKLYLKAKIYGGREHKIDIVNDLKIRMTWTDNEPTGAVYGDAVLVEANNSAIAIDKYVNTFWVESDDYSHGYLPEKMVMDKDSTVIIHISTWELLQPPASAYLDADGGLDPLSNLLIELHPESVFAPTLFSSKLPSEFPSEGGWVEFY